MKRSNPEDRCVTIYTDKATLDRIDAERDAVVKAMPGARVSRSAWALARLQEYFRQKDARASKAAR